MCRSPVPVELAGSPTSNGFLGDMAGGEGGLPSARAGWLAGRLRIAPGQPEASFMRYQAVLASAVSK
jgi:hypothetical protein